MLSKIENGVRGRSVGGAVTALEGDLFFPEHRMAPEAPLELVMHG